MYRHWNVSTVLQIKDKCKLNVTDPQSGDLNICLENNFDVLNMLFKINVNIILNGDFSNFNRQLNLLICFKILPIMYNNLSVAIDNISDHNNIELCYSNLVRNLVLNMFGPHVVNQDLMVIPFQIWRNA